VLTAWRRIPGPPRDRVKARLLRLYRALLAEHGRQRWWPARTPFEVAVGAILVQHTAWASAARAVAALRAARRLTPERLAATDLATLGALVRPAGTWRLKAGRLLDFTRALLAEPARLKDMGERARTLAIPDAAERLVAVLLEVAA